MAKVPDDEDSRLTYAAAAQLVEQGLRNDGSLFTPNTPVWTRENLLELDTRFVKRPDTSKDSFENKFRRQLAGAPPSTIQFAAELVYVNLLITKQMLGSTKRELVAEILSWGGLSISLPPDIDGALDHGLVSPGQAYAVQKPFAVAFLVEFLLRWKALAQADREQALGDPWAFKAHVFAAPAPSAVGQQHALLHLVFPDVFEPIVSDKHKRVLAERFAQGTDKEIVDLDQRLLSIRKRLTSQFGERFSYYRDPLRAEWFPEDGAKPKPEPHSKQTNAQARVWIEKTIVAGRPDRAGGPHALGKALWSPQMAKDGKDIYRTMREVRAGDVILHFVDNRAFVGASVATGPADDSFTGVAGTAWENQPSLRVELSDYVEIAPPLDRDDFFDPEPVRRQLLQIRRDHRGLFYNEKLILNQGSYLTEAPKALVAVLADVYRSKTGKALPHIPNGSDRAEMSSPARPPIGRV